MLARALILISLVLFACASLTGCPRQTGAASPLHLALPSPDALREAARAAQAVERPERLPAPLAKDGPVNRLGLVVHGRPLVFSDPSDPSVAISICEPGEYVPILEARLGFAGVRMTDGRLGWIRGRHIEVLEEPADPPIEPDDPANSRIVARAMRFLGVPYVWGGTTEAGLDCSGFVQRVLREEGISLPRVACDQAKVGITVPLAMLEPGDRLYFQSGREIDHTGLYIGGGRFIHASGSGGCVRVDDLFSERWQRLYVCARR